MAREPGAGFACPPGEAREDLGCLRLEGARVRAYLPLSAELERALPRWLAAGAPEEGRPLKAPDVFRVGGLVVKYFPAPSVFGWVRTPRAERSAARHFRCLPVPSPRPLAAVSSGPRRPSLLVREHLEGRLLSQTWGRDSAATAALAPFLAALRRNRVLHGDLHPRNALWDGERWILLDVDGVRHGLHSEARVVERMWAGLLRQLGDEQAVRALHGRTHAELGRAGDPQHEWAGILRLARAMHRASGAPPPLGD